MAAMAHANTKGGTGTSRVKPTCDVRRTDDILLRYFNTIKGKKRDK